MKRAFRALGWIAALFALGVLAAWSTRASWAPGMIVLAPSPGFEVRDVPQDVRETVEVTRAGARLRTWVFDPPRSAPPRGTVLMLHGIRTHKVSLVSGARGHVARGHRAVAVDLRGHGESSGRYHTYGVEESRDLVALVDELERRGLLARPLAVVGTSYGAATALQYAALDTRVDKVVALAPFTSLRDVVPAYVEWIAGPLARLAPIAMLDELIDDAARHAGFDPDDACPRCAAQRISVPVLLIHSRDDERIPWRHSAEIRNELGASAKLMLVDGVGHVRVGSAPGVDAAIARWLDR